MLSSPVMTIGTTSSLLGNARSWSLVKSQNSGVPFLFRWGSSGTQAVCSAAAPAVPVEMTTSWTCSVWTSPATTVGVGGSRSRSIELQAHAPDKEPRIT